MQLIVGLGNPGDEYKNTRHNIGFHVLDKIAETNNCYFTLEKKFLAQIAIFTKNNQKILLAKPTTYMNNSGQSITLIKNYYKISNDNIFVFHDELDIKFSQIKTKIGGGSAGHNGLKSLDQFIGNDYNRIRIGIGRPENKLFDISNYVLSKFTPNELENLDNIINDAIDIIKI
jgi:PTH1 family peptidyl-tRNA hydrolase